MAPPAASPSSGIHHYSTEDEVPTEIYKYWEQRTSLFSKYEEGIWMTDDSWFGVTPEPVAERIAAHIASAPASKTVLIDAFAGVGGNAIAFARSGRWNQIFAVEKDPKVIECGRHNAEVYGVANKIWWIEGDIFEVIKARFKSVAKKAVVFGSPPWGGPAYNHSDVFDLNMMQPYSFQGLYTVFSRLTGEVVLYLPRTSDLRLLARYARPDKQLEVTHYCMHGASKAMCVFFGDFALQEAPRV